MTGDRSGTQTLADTKLSGISLSETSYVVLVMDGQWKLES